MKIGIFDSGIGGLSVLHEALKRVENGEFIYYADVDNVPYGEKSEERIESLVEGAADFLVSKGAKAIVIACNTATSVGAKKLRAKYNIPIVGMEPAVKRALDLYGQGRVVVAATPVTLAGEKLQELIGRVDTKKLVDLLPLPGLVRFAENRVFKGECLEEYIKGEISKFDLSKYHSLVLGCTHFVFFKDTLRRLLPENIKLVDGNTGTVNQLIRRIDAECERDSAQSSVEYYLSGRKADKATLEGYGELMCRLDKICDIT